MSDVRLYIEDAPPDRLRLGVEFRGNGYTERAERVIQVGATKWSVTNSLRRLADEVDALGDLPFLEIPESMAETGAAPAKAVSRPATST